jgi:hypothetical protein
VTPRSARPRKLDAATEQQAIASARDLIERSGGLSHEYSRDYWRFSTKAELRGSVETGERFLQGIKDALDKQYRKVSICFLPGPKTWNEKLAEKLIADAQQGDADADQVLREVAAEFLTKRIPLPNELADYVAPYLQQANSSKQSHKTGPTSKAHKTEYRDWILALTVNVVAHRFNLYPTRNRDPKNTKSDYRSDCACSIVAQATKLFGKTVPNAWRSEKTVANAWQKYQGIADQRTAKNYVPQAMVSVTPDRGYLMRLPPIRWGGRWVRPSVVSSDGAQVAQEHFLVRFPRVGSIEAKTRAKRQRDQ